MYFKIILTAAGSNGDGTSPNDKMEIDQPHEQQANQQGDMRPQQPTIMRPPQRHPSNMGGLPNMRPPMNRPPSTKHCVEGYFFGHFINFFMISYVKLFIYI